MFELSFVRWQLHGFSPSHSSSLTQCWDLRFAPGMLCLTAHCHAESSIPIPTDPHDSLLANQAVVNPLIPKELIKGS